MERQARIWVPDTPLFNQDDWGENLLGNIIKPITTNHPELDWFWFSRYWYPNLGSNEQEDCIVGELTDQWRRNSTGNFYSFRFRYSISDESRERFETELIDACLGFGCKITNFLNYDSPNDVGNPRHLAEPRTDERKTRRAEMNNKLYHRISLLALDILEDLGNNRFKMEDNDSIDFPLSRSSFRVPLHVFFNITQIYILQQISL
jgi:hypothetical protein